MKPTSEESSCESLQDNKTSRRSSTTSSSSLELSVGRGNSESDMAARMPDENKPDDEIDFVLTMQPASTQPGPMRFARKDTLTRFRAKNNKPDANTDVAQRRKISDPIPRDISTKSLDALDADAVTDVAQRRNINNPIPRDVSTMSLNDLDAMTLDDFLGHEQKKKKKIKKTASKSTRGKRGSLRGSQRGSSRGSLRGSRRGGKRMLKNTSGRSLGSKQRSCFSRTSSGRSSRSHSSHRSRTSVRSLLSRTKNDTSADTSEPFGVDICDSRFNDLYRLGGILGKGSFGIVLECRSRRGKRNAFAVKCVDRNTISDEDLACLLDEVAITNEIKHPNIVRFYEFFTEIDTYFLVMERLYGGELYERIVSKEFYDEEDARSTFINILEAIKYCHFKRIAHRDLKPENLLLSSESDDTNVKLADFGFSTIVMSPNSLRTLCGSPGYAAPEILDDKPYDERCDMWSAGVTLYALLGGYLPFDDESERETADKVCRGEYDFDDDVWDGVSGDAFDLIEGLLTMDPHVRLSATEALQHKWIVGKKNEKSNSSNNTNTGLAPLGENLRNRLSRFMDRMGRMEEEVTPANPRPRWMWGSKSVH